MSYRVLIFAYRKPGMTPAAFKSYYDSSHVPLVQSIAGAHFPNAHIRRYLHRTESSTSSAGDYPVSVLIGAQSDFEYDAIAELIFDDESAFQTFMGIVSQQEAAERIAKDEEMFLNRPKMKVVVLGDITTSGPTPSG